MTYSITFKTDAGGCNKYETLDSNNIQEIKNAIFADLEEDPYVNFWYGQHIIIRNLKTNKKLKIYTEDENSPIKMKLIVDGKQYKCMKELEELEPNSNIDEVVTRALFNDHETLESSEDKTFLKLKFNEECDGHDIMLEIEIDYNFLTSNENGFL